MKKIILIFSLVISFFVFHINYNNYSASEYQKINLQFLTIRNNLKSNYYAVQIEFKENETEVIADIIDFLDKHQYSGFITNAIRNEDYSLTIKNYMYANDKNMLNSMYLKSDKDIYNILDNKGYITTDTSDKMASGYFDFINPTYNKRYNDKTIIYSMSSFPDVEVDTRGNMFYIYGDNKKALKNSLKESDLIAYLGDGWDSDLDFGEPPVNPLDQTTSYVLLLCSIILLFVVMICFLYEKNKELVIRKMHGQSNRYIVKKFFVKYALVLIAAYLLCQLACYGIYISSFRTNTIPFIQILITYFIFFVVILSLIFLLFYLILSKKLKVDSLKTGKTSKNIVKINIVLKMLVLIILMQPLIAYTESGIYNLKSILTLTGNKERYTNFLEFYAVERDYISEINIPAKKFFNDNGAIFENFRIGDIEQTLPYFIANKVYMEDYTVYDTQHNIIDIKNMETPTLLVSEKYSEEDYAQLCSYGSSCNIIKIEDNQTFYSHSSFLVEGQSIRTSPIIEVIDRENEKDLDKNGMTLVKIDNHFTTEQFNKKLVESNLKDKIVLFNTSETYTSSLARSKDELFASA